MKRIICLFLCLLLAVPVASAETVEDPFVLHISSSFGDVGEELVVTGSTVNAPNCASYRIIFTYDPTVLEPVKGESVDPKGMKIANCNSKWPQADPEGVPAVNCLAADANFSVGGDMTLFRVTFKVLAQAENDRSPLAVQHYEFFDNTVGKPKPIAPETVRVGQVYTSGLLEATILLQQLAGYGETLYPLDSDRNGDSTLSIADAVLCLRELAA